ncbi:MAG: hypothetical protein IAF38_09410 [Bacteroidia bacterium]|nr:hypothetical protein [Bacteroidia bacterium]
MSKRRKTGLMIALFLLSVFCMIFYLVYREIWYSNIPEEVTFWQRFLESGINKFLFYVAMVFIPLILVAEIVLFATKKIELRQFLILLVGAPIVAWFIAQFICPVIVAVINKHQ